MSITSTDHPPSLRIFFGTEMWERYGFYVVQSLLALYLSLHFKWPDNKVYGLVGSFTALTYLLPLIGGWIADNLLGQKRAILTGSICLFFSYIILSTLHSAHFLNMALAGIAVGTGLLKPNISALLGNEYSADSSKRESGFTIFYMGITTGIILGTTLPSQLNTYFGWSVSFLSAAVGMILSFSIFWRGIKRYNIHDYHAFIFSKNKILRAALIIAFTWIISLLILQFSLIADAAFVITTLIAFLYLIQTISREKGIQAKQTAVIGLLCIISVMFWSFYFQMFLSLTLFIARVVQPEFLGIAFPPPYYVGLQSLGMIVIGFLLSRHSPKTNALESGRRTALKFFLAMFFLTAAYALISFSCFTGADNKLSPLFVIPAYLLFSIAELLLSPVGLAAITILASRHKVSTMMGIFFVSLGIGAFFSGNLAKITSITSVNMPLHLIKLHYAETFRELLILLIAASILSFILVSIVRKFLLPILAHES